MRQPGEGAVVVVTGASTGIGRATAVTLADAGYHVFAGVRKESDGEALTELSRGTLTPLLIDVTDSVAVAEAAERVDRVVGDRGLAGLVNNAGIGLTSSKWALASITEALRLELRPWAIRVGLIEPASISTDAVGKAEAEAEQVLQRLDDVQRARYGATYRTMIDRAVGREKNGSSPQVVADLILRVLTITTPKTRYLVGRDARRLAFLARWLPDGLFDHLRLRLFGLPTQFGGPKRHREP